MYWRWWFRGIVRVLVFQYWLNVPLIENKHVQVTTVSSNQIKRIHVILGKEPSCFLTGTLSLRKLISILKVNKHVLDIIFNVCYSSDRRSLWIPVFIYIHSYLPSLRCVCLDDPYRYVLYDERTYTQVMYTFTFVYSSINTFKWVVYTISAEN